MSLHGIICRFYKHILIVTLVLTMAASLSALRLRLDLNFFSLLPSGNGSIESFLDVMEVTGGHSVVIALVDMPLNQERGKSEAVIDILAANWGKIPAIREVEYKSGEDQSTDLLRSALEYLPLFIKKGDLGKVADKLSDEGIEKQIAENKRLLMTPFGIAMKELIYADPLGLSGIVMGSMPSHSLRRSFTPERGYFAFDDGKTYLVFIKPVKSPQDIAFSKKLMGRLRHIEETALSELAHTHDIDAEKIKVSYTGGYPIAVSDEATTRKDIKVTLLTSLIGVLLLFGLAFRTWKILFCVGLSLVISLVWTLGFAGIAFRHLNILTCVFSCVLLGLGIDFAIHIVNRYFSEEKIKMDMSRRLQHTFRECGSGILIGAVTTATAFYAIATSDFRGFKELGIITGTGILICVAVMVFVLPALLIFFSGEKEDKKKIVIRSFGIQPVIDRLVKRPRSLLAVSFAVILLLAVIGHGVKFDDNLRNFRTAENEVFRLQEKVTRWLGGSTGRTFLVVKGETELQTMEMSARASDALDELRQEGVIASFRSISQYLVSPEEQERNRGLLRQNPAAFDMERIRQTFYSVLEKNGFEAVPPYRDYMKTLSRAFSQERVLLPSDLDDREMEKRLEPLFFQRDGSFSSIIYIAPSRDLWSRSETASFAEMVTGKLAAKGVARDNYTLTGSSLLSAELRRLIMDNLRWALWLACMGIAVVLLLYYRNLKFFALALLPVILGMAVLAGIMAIFRIDFNFLNVIVIPMIVGIGIDDGVHLTNTFREKGDVDIVSEISLTGRAVLLTSLTTLVGFGSIVLAHYPGLKSMGYVAVIGVGACMLVSLLVLPPIFYLLRSREK